MVFARAVCLQFSSRTLYACELLSRTNDVAIFPRHPVAEDPKSKNHTQNSVCLCVCVYANVGMKDWNETNKLSILKIPNSTNEICATIIDQNALKYQNMMKKQW